MAYNTVVKTVDLDVIIIGAGAAGFMCAIEAAKRGRRVFLLDKSKKIGEKIRISGGGRCNFTNINASPENYISSNPHFCRSALAKYTPQDFIDLVEEYNIAYHEKKLGQLFCDYKSTQIIDLLFSEARKYAVQIIKECEIFKVDKSKDSQGKDKYKLETSHGIFFGDSLVLATGGLSIPQIGASGFGYHIARQFDINVVETSPALVPFTCKGSTLDRFQQLSGVSIDALISCCGQSFRENILFTHKGLSGPAVLQISSYWNPNAEVIVDLLPDLDFFEYIKKLKSSKESKKSLKNILKEFLPSKFVDIWGEAYKFEENVASLSFEKIQAIEDSLKKLKIQPSGTEGYAKAEVTRGGVDTNELSSKTMEARKQPGLYFIGEVVDVTGQLGGYNFQWAWASGYTAGQYC